MFETKVKICGLTRRKDALHAAEAGADFLGVVSVPNTPRFQTPEEARALLDGIQLPSVIVVANLDLPRLMGAAEIVGAAVIQLHGDEPPDLVSELREGGPWEVWKALRVRGQADVREELARYGEVADGLLLDGWHPEKSGGAGVAFSWDGAVGVRDSLPPGLLFGVAGGLSPENVCEAMRRLRPHLVDVSSGVEEGPGVKDPSRVEAFIRSVRAAGGGERS